VGRSPIFAGMVPEDSDRAGLRLWGKFLRFRSLGLAHVRELLSDY